MKYFTFNNIISALLLLIILGLLYILLTNQQISNDKFKFIIGLISFSTVILFLLNIFKNRTTNNPQEKKQKRSSENIQSEIDEEMKKEQIEFHSLSILKEIQKHTKIDEFSDSLLIKFAKQFSAVQGVFYVKDNEKLSFRHTASYALYKNPEGFIEGNGINGQVALNKKLKVITQIPENYITVISGLGSASPKNMLIIPFVFNNQTIALVELASFDPFPEFITEIYNEINNSLAEKINQLIS
jgi:hypothetical protein